MECPPRGICRPVEVVKIIDGDTLRVRPVGEFDVRLLDCWAPERRTPEGKDAIKRLKEMIKNASETALYVPFDNERSRDVFTFGRVLGRIFADRSDVSEVLIEAGLATRKKPR